MSTAPVITETPTEVAEVPTPIIEVPVIEVPEQVYYYQPTDDSGRALGGKQAIKYRTHEELTQKLTDQNVLLVRKLREETRKNRLGISDPDDIPAEALRFDQPVDFKARELTADERIKLSRDLLDPERFDEASTTLFEATVGVTPVALRSTLTNLQVGNLKLLAKAESDAFMQQNPEYHPCKENFDGITSWMIKKNLAPVRDNFQLAYNTLRTAGLLLEAPIVREEAPTSTPSTEVVQEPTPANTLPVQEEPSRITEATPALTKRPVATIPSGLNRSHTSDGGTEPKKRAYTLAEIDAMPSEIYKRKLLHEKGFRELYEELEAERQKKKR